MTDDYPGRPIWLELFTADTETAGAFFAQLLGWTVQDTGEEYGGYALFLRDGEPVAGLMANTQGAPDAWTVYLETNNAADTVAMAKANGGQVVVDAMAVGDLGHMAVVTDPSGAVVGIWQPGRHTGFATTGEDGAPAWFEVLTTDYETGIHFYENVFGWDVHTLSDTEDLRYATLGKDAHARAGIMDATALLAEAGRTPYWASYLQVADTDATAARAVELGGSVVAAPEDTPYGRIATLGDPTGLPFNVMGPNRG